MSVIADGEDKWKDNSALNRAKDATALGYDNAQLTSKNDNLKKQLKAAHHENHKLMTEIHSQRVEELESRMT